MEQDISLKVKGKTHDLNHDLTFYAHTINCVCHSIRSMFRVLGIYNFALRTFILGGKLVMCWMTCTNWNHLRLRRRFFSEAQVPSKQLEYDVWIIADSIFWQFWYIHSFNIAILKGQLISKCLFGVIFSTKMATKIL